MPPALSLEEAVRLALADAADAAGHGGPPPQLLSAESVTWPNGALGCEQEGRAYTMALVPGYLIRVSCGEQVLHYHAARRGRPFLCPADRARPPIRDERF